MLDADFIAEFLGDDERWIEEARQVCNASVELD